MREHVVAASKAMKKGDWKQCRDYILAVKVNFSQCSLVNYRSSDARNYFFQISSLKSVSSALTKVFKTFWASLGNLSNVHSSKGILILMFLFSQ